MKNRLLMFIAILVASAGISKMQAQAVYTDVTSTYVQNPTMNALGGWITTTAPQNSAMASNQTGAFNVPFWENWAPNPFVGKMYQELTDLPAGVYRLQAAVFTETQSTSLYLYGGSSKIAVTGTSPTTYEVDFLVPSSTGTTEIGVIAEAAVTKWMGLDNIVLSYSTDVEATYSFLNSRIAEATTLLGEGSGQVTSTLEAAILAGNKVLAGGESTLNDGLVAVAALDAAINAAKYVSVSPAGPVDFTGKILNPNFEIYSATNALARVPGWLNSGAFALQGNTSFGSKVGTYYCEKYTTAASLPNGTISQKLVGLPNGYYKLTAAAGFDGSGASIFANGDKTEFGANGDYNVITEVVDGALSFGIELLNTTSNYVRFDNFRLSYTKDNPVIYEAKLALAAMLLRAGNVSGTMSTNVQEVLTARISAAAAVAGSEEFSVLEDALTALTTAVTDAEASVAKYAQIPSAIGVANTRMAYYVNYTGYADFEEAITSAIGTLNSVYTTKTADVATVDLALTTFGTTYNTLEKALRTPGSGTDYTMAITNPDFSAALAAPWQGYTGTLANGVYEFYQANFDMYQDLDVPAGVYELGVQGLVRVTWNDAGSNYKRSLDNVSYYLYAEIAGSDPKKEWMIPIASLYSDENTGATNGYANTTTEANAAFNTSQKYLANALKAIEVGEGETLRIGVRGSGTAAGRWVCFDNFSLTQMSAVSSAATQAEIDALKVLTDKAEGLLTDDISPAAAVLQTEKNLHVNYEAGVTESSVVLAAIQAMPTAIETYRSAYIKNYSFEDPTDPITVGVSPTLTNWTRNYVDGYSWNGCNNDWKTDGERSYGIWKAAIDSDFEVSQVVTVPDGTYLVTVDMAISKAGTTSRVNGQRLFAGNVEAYYPAYAETDTDNGLAYTLSVITVAVDGQLKLGVRTNGGTASGIGWFKIDNFTIKKVSDNTTLELIDWMDFNASENQTVDVSYTRTFMTAGVNSTTTNGWQSICLPFNVTKIEIADTYSQNYIDLTGKANEKFWLYKISESGYTPASTIQAHEYYLIALPNDVDYYAEGVSLSGDVTFYGTEVLATPALPQVEMPLFYVRANFKSLYSGYGITDVDNNSVFKQGHNNGTFWVHALPKDGNGFFTAFNVFGTTDPTSLRQTDLGDTTSQPVVVTVEGGLEIAVAVSQMIRIYTVGGELVKVLKIPAGTTRIDLPAGPYVVNNQKVFVTN